MKEKFVFPSKNSYLCSTNFIPFVMFSITYNANLLAHNTFKMEVKAAILAEYETAGDLQPLLQQPDVQALMEKNRQRGQLPFWHIGSGSNLLFQGDYDGVVLHCKAQGMQLIEDTPTQTLLQVQAGTIWDDVCAYCADQGLYGTENLSLIPGEAGAAAVQNIGAYGVEMKDIVESVICWDLLQDCPCTLTAQDMQYGYRQSLLKQPEAKSRYIVTSVILRLTRQPHLHLEYAGLKQALQPETLEPGTQKPETLPSPTPAAVRSAVIRIREGKLPDPQVLGNAGSFFKNPIVPNELFQRLLLSYPTMPHYVVDATHTKIPAGWLIEQCGWKGKSLGRAGVYQKQSLVLVNLGGATPKEIITLCQTVRRDVLQKFGIDIEPEVNII